MGSRNYEVGSCAIWVRSLLLVVLVTGLSACGGAKPTVELEFVEQEAGVDPYKVRMLVNEHFLRIDEGKGSEGFVLFDREKREVYSAGMMEDHRLLVVKETPFSEERPGDLVLNTEQKADDDVPPIAGVKPKHYVFAVNDKVCREAMIADRLLPDVVAVLREYRDVMVGQQYQSLMRMPADMRSDCQLSQLVFDANAVLDKGFPVLLWDESGYRRLLTHYRNVSDDDLKWTKLPDGMERFSLSDRLAQ